MKILTNLVIEAGDTVVVRHRDDLDSSYIKAGQNAGWAMDDGRPYLLDVMSIAIDGTPEQRADILDEIAEQATAECLRLRALAAEAVSS